MTQNTFDGRKTKGLVRTRETRDFERIECVVGLKQRNAVELTLDLGKPVTDFSVPLTWYRHTVQSEVHCRASASAFSADAQPINLRQEMSRVYMTVFEKPSNQVALLLG